MSRHRVKLYMFVDDGNDTMLCRTVDLPFAPTAGLTLMLDGFAAQSWWSQVTISDVFYGVADKVFECQCHQPSLAPNITQEQLAAHLLKKGWHL